jgi:hypothetical protein
MTDDALNESIERLRKLGESTFDAWTAQVAVPDYLHSWARELSRCVSRGGLKRLAADYAARERDKRLDDETRSVNRERAKALKKYGSSGK